MAGCFYGQSRSGGTETGKNSSLERSCYRGSEEIHCRSDDRTRNSPGLPRGFRASRTRLAGPGARPNPNADPGAKCHISGARDRFNGGDGTGDRRGCSTRSPCRACACSFHAAGTYRRRDRRRFSASTDRPDSAGSSCCPRRTSCPSRTSCSSRAGCSYYTEDRPIPPSILVCLRLRR